jgi:tetratricopeptide (TPR) repeat protein
MNCFKIPFKTTLLLLLGLALLPGSAFSDQASSGQIPQGMPEATLSGLAARLDDYLTLCQQPNDQYSSCQPYRGLVKQLDSGELVLRDYFYKQALNLRYDVPKAEAVRLLEKELAAFPDHYDALVLLGTLLLAKNEQDRPIVLLTRAIELMPTRPEARMQRADQFLELLLFDRALADVDAQIQLKPDDASAWHLRGRIHEAMEQPEQSLADYTRALALVPSDHLYYARGSVYETLGRETEARADFRQSCAEAGGLSLGCQRYWEGESEQTLEPAIISLAEQVRQAQAEFLRLKQIRDQDPDNQVKAQAVTDYMQRTHNLYLMHLWALLEKYRDKHGSESLQALIDAKQIPLPRL